LRKITRGIKRLGGRVVCRTLRGYVRAQPRAADVAGAERRVLILLLSAWGMGGTIRAAHNLAGYLVANGYEVEIASVFRDRREPFFGRFPPGVKVTALDDRRRDRTERSLRPLIALMRRVPSALAHSSDRQGDWWSLWVDIRLARTLRRRAGFFVTTRPSLNLIAAELSPPGLITVAQEQINLSAWSPRLREAMARKYPELDALVVLTDGDVRQYDELLAGQLRLARIPNSVHAMGGSDPDLGERTVLAAGRLTHQKGFDLLIPAFAKVAGEHPDWRVRICGKGEQQAELRELIASHGLQDRIELAGPVGNMAEEMAMASVFVLSSRFEGFPLILIEAMSKGLAVVSFDCPTGPGEIIDDHRNGLLVAPNDIDALAGGLGEMMGDEELRRRCAAAGRETARDYAIDAIGPQWNALFVDLLAARNQRARTAASTAEPLEGSEHR